LPIDSLSPRKAGSLDEIPPEIKAALDSALRKETSPQQVQADIGSLWAPRKYLRMGATQDFVGRIALAREVSGTLCRNLRGISDRNCAESSGAGWSSLQETAEHSGEGKNILYHFTFKLQEKMGRCIIQIYSGVGFSV
jgi:hypothetical protein